MRRAEYLKPGDEIRLIAPSRWVDQTLVNQTSARLIEAGFKVSSSANILARQGQFAGRPDQRSTDFIAAWSDESVKAIWALRGGYGAQQMLDTLERSIDFSQAKWYVGFSDSTAIHGMLSQRGCMSLHGAMGSTFASSNPDHVTACMAALKGPVAELNWSAQTRDIPGQVRGRLVGGNLSVLQTMIGSPSFPLERGDILFIEDLDEMLYHLDRMMTHLARAGVLAQLGGVLVGSMSDMRDNTSAYGFSTDNPYGLEALDIIAGHVAQLGIPVGFGLAAGHGYDNQPLVLGGEVQLEIAANGNSLSWL